jgi:hypothetical protein
MSGPTSIKFALALTACCGSLIGIAHAQIFQTTRSDSIEDLIPPVDRTESTAARAELAQARLALMRSQTGATQVIRMAETGIQQQDPIKQARREAMRARMRYEALQRPILEALRKDEEYARLNQEQLTARKMIDQLVAEQRREFDDLLPHAKAALEAGRKMTRFEVIALAMDPAVEDARIEMVQAYGRLRELTQQARRAAAADAGLRFAVQDVESAKARVQAAMDRLRVALQKEADAERLRDAQLEQLRRGGVPELPDEKPGAKRNPNASTGTPSTRPAK